MSHRLLIYFTLLFPIWLLYAEMYIGSSWSLFFPSLPSERLSSV